MGCLVLVLLPIVELTLLVWLGGRIGFLPLAVFLVATGLVGAALARAEGVRVIRQIQAALREGQAPEEGLISALLVFIGGALLVFPGLVSDLAGVLLLFPPSRVLVLRRLESRWRRGLRDGKVIIGHRSPLDDVIDVEAEPVDPARPALPPRADLDDDDKGKS